MYSKVSYSKSINEKLNILYKKKEYYEAEQLLRTFYKRLNMQKKYIQSFHLLRNGLIKLFFFERKMSAGCISIDVLDTWVASKQNSSILSVDNLVFLFSFFHLDLKNVQNIFTRKSTIWLRKNKRASLQLKKFNNSIGKLFEERNCFSESSKFYLYTDDKSAVQVDLLKRWSMKEISLEQDFIISRIVLQHLCLKKVDEANTFLDVFRNMEMFHGTPVVNLINFLLNAIETKSLTLFEMIVKTYRIIIEKDSDFIFFINLIGTLYFDLKKNNYAEAFGKFFRM